jgi:hypothetical protein
VPEVRPWTVLNEDADVTMYYVGSVEIALFQSEAERYRENLNSGAPGVWVVLHSTGVSPAYEIMTVTADPSEGEGLTQTGADLVESVPMPPSIRTLIEAFVAEHHVEEPFYKRERDHADPEALARHDRRVKGEESDG